MKAYDEEDKYNEYLVDGAVLWCDQATLEDFELPDGEKIVLELETIISPEIRCWSVLKITENPMSVNGKIYATVRDTVKGENVMPFRCNCKQKVNRDAEAERIQSDPECGKYGVCRHLMQLNEKWDNMPRETGYMKLKDGIPNTTAGVADVLGSDSGLWVAEEGITMTSVLFCKHGGLIRAIRSGQEEVVAEEETDTDENELNENEADNNIVTGVSDRFIDLLKNYETGADQKGNDLPQGQPALQPYHGKSDPAGSLTIGWGHYMAGSDIHTFQDENGNEVTVDLYDWNTVITLEQAEQLLAEDIAIREEIINGELEARGVRENVNQHFYDALFSLYYQIPDCFEGPQFSAFLDRGNFDPVSNGEEIKFQFGDFTNDLELGTMRRRADELEIIFYDNYERGYSVKQFGDIWRKITYPNEVTEYPEGAE
ncbi:MAG: lysozyme [Lachnospiraceae bacterium]|nr:lysozyme [Lachnospiraceae bacterium]